MNQMKNFSNKIKFWPYLLYGSIIGAAIASCSTNDRTHISLGGGVCGNAIVETPEECDDGNNNNFDKCTNVCTVNDPSTTSTTSTGSNTCGDGKLDAGETCDDGNDDDNDSCKNNCTSNAPKTCGNGKIDAGEECDDGNNIPDDECTNLCKDPYCGDGIIQTNEDCDDGGKNGEFGSNCPDDCKNEEPTTVSSSSSGDPCAGQKTFAAVVSNNNNPNLMGAGVASKWTYAGLEGLQAGDSMCQAIGADHVCRYHEVVKAEASGELAALPTNLTYWLHRTTSVPNPMLNNKMCSSDAECTASNTLAYCDPVAKICSYKPGAGGRCNDWTYPTGHISDGEWFETFKNGNSKNNGGVKTGNLVYHFDGDTFYDGVSQTHLCKSETTLGCSGACAGATRAILCCYPVCK